MIAKGGNWGNRGTIGENTKKMSDTTGAAPFGGRAGSYCTSNTNRANRANSLNLKAPSAPTLKRV